jgi:hypothetical protein
MSIYTQGSDPNNATDVPDYGTIFSSGWSCDDWKTWFMSLLSADAANSTNNAKSTWNAAWDNVPDYAYEAYTCPLEPTWVQFVKDNGLTAGNSATNAVASVEAGVTGAVDSVGTGLSNVGTAISNVTKAISNTTGTITWLLPAVLIGVIVIVLYKVSQAHGKASAGGSSVTV